MKKKVSRFILPVGVLLVALLIIGGILLFPKINNHKEEDGQILLGEKPEAIVPNNDWLVFATDAPFTFSYPTTWGIEATPVEEGKQGVHVVGPEGELFMYWGSGFGGACEPAAMKEIKLKDEALNVCNEVGGDGTESWRLISKEVSPEVSFDARAVATTPADKNREMILAILSTLSFKK